MSQKSIRVVEPEPADEEQQPWTATDLFGLVDCVIEDVASGKCVWRSLPDDELCISYWELPDGRYARVVFAVVDPMVGTEQDAINALSFGPVQGDATGRDDRGFAPHRAAAAFVLLKRSGVPLINAAPL
jgi:hypothetical protein